MVVKQSEIEDDGLYGERLKPGEAFALFMFMGLLIFMAGYMVGEASASQREYIQYLEHRFGRVI